MVRLRYENPVLTKELRTRMRGARAYWILFAYLFVLSLILFFTYLTWWQSQQNAWGGGNAAFAVGKTFYTTLFITQALLVGLITPALTAGGISIEKEQRTYELLSATLLPRRAIIVGKLMAAASFVVLLLTSSLPLVSLCFLLGGVSPAEVFAAYILLVVVALQYGAVGVAWSALSRNTSTATVLSYGTIILLFLLTLPLAMANLGRAFGGPGFGTGLSAINPIGAVVAGTAIERYWGWGCPAWMTALLLNGLLTVILVVVAIHRLEYPLTDRSGLLRLLTALFTVLLALCLFGSLLPRGGWFGMNDSQRLMVAGVLTILGMCVLVPIFTTGDALPRGGILAALDPRRLRVGDPASGMLYTLLIAALVLLILTLGAPESLRPRVGALVVLVGTLVFCFGAVGLFFTALVGNRWSAISVTVSAMLLLFLTPMVSLMNYSPGSPGSILDNFLYLSPFPAAANLSDIDRNFWRSVPPLWGGRTPFYVVTPVLYALSGVGFLIAAQAAHTARCRSRAVAPTPAPASLA